MNRRDIIVIGGSSGSREPLRAIVAALPIDFQGFVFVVTHLPSTLPSLLPEIIQKSTPLPVQHAVDDLLIAPGTIYFGPPGSHLILQSGRMRLGRGPRENMARPAVDALFRSAALEFGSRVVGVVLSGLLNDGAAGVAAIKQRGGLSIVQDPDTAIEGSMPWAALQAAPADYCIDATQIGPLLATLVHHDAPESAAASQALKLEVDIALGGRCDAQTTAEIGDPAPLTCPNCHGALSEIRGQDGPLRFRCQTGHAFTAAVLDECHEPLDEALRVALRMVEERAELTRRMGIEAAQAGRKAVARLYTERSAEFTRDAEVIRNAALRSAKPEP
jgi:two-component system chemotaxis response regulator CheB